MAPFENEKKKKRDKMVKNLGKKWCFRPIFVIFALTIQKHALLWQTIVKTAN
jgi:hypothetical protein